MELNTGCWKRLQKDLKMGARNRSDWFSKSPSYKAGGTTALNKNNHGLEWSNEIQFYGRTDKKKFFSRSANTNRHTTFS